MRFTTISMLILIVTLDLSATNAVAKDEVYRWVDENGVVHFGDRPDGQSNAEPVDIQTSRGSSTQPSSAPLSTDTGQQQEPQPSYAQQRRDKRAEKRKETSEKQRAIAAGCAQRRQLIARLEPSARVMVELEDGSVIRMDDDERLKTLGEAKTYVADKCDK